MQPDSGPLIEYNKYFSSKIIGDQTFFLFQKNFT